MTTMAIMIMTMMMAMMMMMMMAAMLMTMMMMMMALVMIMMMSMVMMMVPMTMRCCGGQRGRSAHHPLATMLMTTSTGRPLPCQYTCPACSITHEGTRLFSTSTQMR